MNHEIDDYELDTTEPEIEIDNGSNGPPRPPERTGLWVAILVVLAIIVAGSLYFFLRPKPEPEVVAEQEVAEQAEEAEPVAEPEALPEEEIELPELAASDAFVREVAVALSSRPELTKWLATDELVRRFVATVSNVAEGVSPRPHLTFLAPEGRFSAIDLGGDRFVVDPKTYKRYDQLAGVFGSLDAEGTARLLHDLTPLFDEAYAELGYPGRSFEEVLSKAIRSLLAVPIPDDAVRLEPAVSAYKYSSGQLESMTPAQKHLLRTGPENTRVFQAKLREIQAAMAKL